MKVYMTNDESMTEKIVGGTGGGRAWMGGVELELSQQSHGTINSGF